MRYIELKYGNKVLTNERVITQILRDNNFNWLIDSEIQDATIEIKNNTIIWESGEFIWGRWHYGIFKTGIFSGIWENGIWENGDFRGKWISGVKLT